MEEVSMPTLYINKVNDYIHVNLGDIHIKYVSPNGLIKFLGVNSIDSGVISMRAQFKSGIDEEYIDLVDVFSRYNYEIQNTLLSITDIKIGEQLAMAEKTGIRDQIISKSVLVSDNIAMIAKTDSNNRVIIQAISLRHTKKISYVDLLSCKVLDTNMGDKLLKRTISAVDRNNKDEIMHTINKCTNT